MKFHIPSTDCIIELDHIQKDKKPILHFRYVNKDKPNFTTYQENVDKAERMQVWKRI